jgi:alpha-L-rhamnosidase
MNFVLTKYRLLFALVCINTVSQTAFAAIPVLTTNTLPASGSDIIGGQITFTAAFSSASAIAYQWRKDTGSGPVNIAGATNTTLTLTNLVTSDSAFPGYSLQASNSDGTASSGAGSFQVNPAPSPANGVIVSTANQTGYGTGTFTPTWSITSGSLIAGLPPSSVDYGNFSLEAAGGVTVLTDGKFGVVSNGSTGSHPAFATCGSGGGSSLIYTLPAASPNGFDLSAVVVYGGWNDNGRDQQGYTVYYSTVTAPNAFVPLATVNYTPSISNGVQSATRVTISPSGSGPMATNVVNVKFDFTTVNVENGYEGYSEIQVFGAPSTNRPAAHLPIASPSSSVGIGTNVVLTEVASGVAPLQYQWQSDNGSGNGDFENILGATGSNYTVDTSAIGNDTVSYRVLVTDTNAAVASPALPVTVTDPSVITAIASGMRCEYLQNPLGIDVTSPRLSWTNNLSGRGAGQSAYQVIVASSPAILAQNQGDLWNSGKVATAQPFLVAYDGQPLFSRENCYWKVRIWDQNGDASAWSSSGMWSMGLLEPGDWDADWIGMDTDTNITPASPSPRFRTTFEVAKPVARATAYICGLGYNELYLNGSKVGNHVLDPTWTRYDYHAYYATYDVTTNLVEGENAVGVQLANGYYNQWAQDAWNTYNAPWRALPQMIVQLEITYTDGTTNSVLSDDSWKASTGPLLLDATRLGEVYDARLEQAGWMTTNYDDSAWSSAILREGIAGSLLAPDSEPIEVLKTVPAVNIIPVAGQPGVYTFDFGQNLVGWGRLTVSGPAGTSVRMVYSEKTNSDGSVNQNNINYLIYTYQQYFQSDTYILKGAPVETWNPHFTYHGFRYAEVTGLPNPPTTNTLVACVLHTAFDPAGSFVCSSPLLNQIESNAMWSYIGDFVGIPTDCPTREKNGWTGDAQLACETGLTHFHGESDYTRWMEEFVSGQMPNGELSGVFPNANWGYGEGPAWESAALLVPWFVYQHCGDVRILTNSFGCMKAYVDYETSVASSNIVSYGLGDWEPANTVTPPAVTDTGYYYQGALIVAQTASLMGNDALSEQYSNLATQIAASFNNAFFNTNTSQYAGGTQTAQSCALYQGLVSSNQVPAVANNLANAVAANGNLIDTGILGSKYLLRALCDSGHSDTAMALATQTAYPSWGNWVVNGATTLWETWSGAGSGDSLNHIMFGDISAWFIEYLAGIRSGAPGYSQVIIKPEITGAIGWAQASHDSPYGPISSAWKISVQTISLNVAIPPGATGIVYLPTLGTPASALSIQESGATIWQSNSVTGASQGVSYNSSAGSGTQTYSVWNVSSGNFAFVWDVFPSPSELTANAGNAWVDLSWNATPGAASYEVKRSSVSGGPYSIMANSVVGTNYTDMTAANGRTWYYVVSANESGSQTGNSSEVSATPSSILNFGFEIPRVAGYEYGPAGAGWSFSGASPDGSGITGNNSGFTDANPPAPQGTQVAFLQEYGAISQTLYGFLPGTNYTITFSAAQRADANQHGGQTWNVLIDGRVIASYNPGSNATSYVDYTAGFAATATAHTLTFVGTDLVKGDNTVFIDNVRLSPPLVPGLSAVSLTTPAYNSSFAAPATIKLAATVVTNGNAINVVQFYANATNLIAQTEAPYAYSWSNVTAGAYSLSAQVIFNGGGAANSFPVSIVVTNLPPVIGGIVFEAAGQKLDIFGNGVTNQLYVLSMTTNLAFPVLWQPILTNLSDFSGNISFSNVWATNYQQFFRIFGP